MLFFVTGEETTNNKAHDHFDKHWPGSIRDDVYTKRYKFEEKQLLSLNHFLTTYIKLHKFLRFYTRDFSFRLCMMV
ncbi:hypothetical protein DC345_31320 [Paenibacillus taichungensis]|uniref:Uncharacterized protein n=1 Tax=Paenibacillus taichungensis TaxID=484184 RepID=A0A329QDQ9_9BACL|nr:hypothetical protein DC345_31320 [Paenibacillus taichungensis]